MPECIESRMISNDLKIFIGKSISSYILTDKAKSSGFETLICPIVIKNVKSHGKKIIFEFENQLMIVSLGMSGRFQYEEGKHSHIHFNIDNTTLYYEDPRRFGKIIVIDKTQQATYFSKLGPCLLTHALDKGISKKQWRKLYQPKLLKRKMADILLDQSIVSGIGLYLMTEILYWSKISPLRIGNTITKKELECIRIHAHKVVLEAYKHGGLTIKNYLSPNQRKGVYKTSVYGHKKDPNGYKVINVKLGGKKSRTVHYIKEIQK